ncbi:MAG: cytochrome c [Proteobacteria bacterium]|nr:cytochrome c [Pseudomonadota bacterium]
MRVRLFVDDETSPRAEFEPPDTFELDTTGLVDGPHVLRVVAGEDGAPAGVETIPFSVRNGPGIAVVGLAENETVAGRIPILVNAYQSRIGDEFEPVRAETPAPIPTWAWVLCLLVGVWGLYFLAAEYRAAASRVAAAAPGPASGVTPELATALPRAATSPAADDTALGEQTYGNYCSACHQLSGDGVPGVFPPLRGDPVVLADDPTEHIRVILEGLQGRAIGGVMYAAAMPAFAAQLSDAEIAAVVNHERTNWGHEAPRVEAADVAALRADAPR